MEDNRRIVGIRLLRGRFSTITAALVVDMVILVGELLVVLFAELEKE